ncbi:MULTISPECIES: MFS transporter [Exiguobacterium]|uniref:Putative proline/betaine transporter n=1 Tax=Exiguobacterium acetylicum TaxID=41170 RepID=A0ABX8G5T2_EXIAC|nr:MULTISPECIES: MFS transporter [Exiguobacterium]AOT00856.1 MFS transporter [Exiguobacterium sp. U13-1]QWB28806.1 MFS transporter [Exiguobacterium acetylicum]HCD58513.1 MFS transporter [Exiguobacterium sp.]
MKFRKEKVNVVDMQQTKKSVYATGIGNAMEWFDFGLYSYLAIIISQNFFSAVENDELKLVFTFATFAIAFLMRPIGGIVFGRIGDRLGRKVVLTTTIVMMAGSTLIIGLLPTYDQIGIWAPILLLLARILQGFSTGGEYAGAMVYIAESSPDNKRSALGSGLEIGTLGGYILASLLATTLFVTLSDDQMASWGWRIPFILGAPLGLFGLYLRRHLDESPIFENEINENTEEPATFREILRDHKRDIIVCFIAVAFFNITNYMLLSYMPSYLDEVIGMSSSTSTILITGVMVIMIPLAYFFGKLSDKKGNRNIVLFALAGLSLLSILSFFLIGLKPLFFVGIGIFILGFFLAIFEGTMPSLLPSIFYTDVRYRTLSVTFNVSVSIFGGTTPLVSTWLVHTTQNPLAPAFYLTAVSVIGFVTFFFFFKNTAGKALKGSHPTVSSEKEVASIAKKPNDALWWAE